MIHEKQKQFFDYLNKNYPKSALKIKSRKLIGPCLLSPFSLKLPSSILIQVKNFVANIHQISESHSYQSKLPKDFQWQTWPKNPSLLTCFDFHHSEKTGLKLIEINTNAAFYISSHIFLLSQRLLSPDPQMKALLESFKISFSLKPKDQLFIMDRNPKKEGLYFEFLLFQEWLENQGYKVEILPLENYTEKAQKIYNRFTDFYFSEPESGKLMEDYISQKVIFSPNPRGFFLLADKRRQKLLRDELYKINSEQADIIPQLKTFSDFESRELLWSERKKYFFKPGQSHGGKAVFKGKSISRKMFNEIYSPDFIAQELCPPGEKFLNATKGMFA